MIKITEARTYRNPAKVSGGSPSSFKPKVMIGHEDDQRIVTKKAWKIANERVFTILVILFKVTNLLNSTLSQHPVLIFMRHMTDA